MAERARFGEHRFENAGTSLAFFLLEKIGRGKGMLEGGLVVFFRKGRRLRGPMTFPFRRP